MNTLDQSGKKAGLYRIEQSVAIMVVSEVPSNCGSGFCRFHFHIDLTLWPTPTVFRHVIVTLQMRAVPVGTWLLMVGVGHDAWISLSGTFCYMFEGSSVNWLSPVLFDHAILVFCLVCFCPLASSWMFLLLYFYEFFLLVPSSTSKLEQVLGWVKKLTDFYSDVSEP